LFTKLNCQQCHAIGGLPANGGAAAVPVPNLALAGNRLKPAWISRWLHNPSAIVPGTKMPAFWGTDEEPVVVDSTIFGGNRNMQIEAVANYVWRLGGSKGNVMPGAMESQKTSISTNVSNQVVEKKVIDSTKTKGVVKVSKDSTKKISLK
jgi:mono/diheme cytochrome c family protein